MNLREFSRITRQNRPKIAENLFKTKFYTNFNGFCLVSSIQKTIKIVEKFCDEPD